MCGLAGFLNFNARFDQLTLERLAGAMSESVSHRGPDDVGIYCEYDVGLALGFRRLSIIDLSPSGHQPMVSASGRSVIVFNGEIYNHLEIRSELGTIGRYCKGRSDTEVLLEACEAWGVRQAIEQCIGMFAFAWYDRTERQLWLVRDRLGEKPLYIAECGQSLLFGSQPKVFRAHPDFVPEIDPRSLSAYVRFGYVPSPRSIYMNVSQLRPGTILRVSSTGARTEELYWDPNHVAAAGIADPFTGSESELLEELDFLLRDAVQRRLVADVPLGAFLSGGIDSSLIVAMHRAQNGAALKTFTVGFHEPTYDEALHARRVANHLGTDHRELYLTGTDALACVSDLANWFDEPFADNSQISTLLLAKFARSEVTVTLSGDGGDELFAGYNRYKRILKKLEVVPEPTSHPRSMNLLGHFYRRFAWQARGSSSKGERPSVASGPPPWELLYRDLVQLGLEPNLLMHGPDELVEPLWLGSLAKIAPDVLSRCQLIDMLTYLPDDILTKVDRATMSVGLEARAPFLDNRLVEFAWRLPITAKLRGTESKWALRRLLERRVPQNIVDRPKMGFVVPTDVWLRGPLRAWAEDLLLNGEIRKDGLFDGAVVERLWKEHLGGVDRHLQIWCVLMFQVWKHRWLGADAVTSAKVGERTLTKINGKHASPHFP